MKYPIIAVAILAFASKAGEAADFSGTWVGRMDSVSSAGKAMTECDATLTIRQTAISYIEALRVVCGHIRTAFEAKPLTIHGNSLMLGEVIVGSLTDTEVSTTTFHEGFNVTIQTQGSQKKETLNLVITMGALGMPDADSWTALLRRAGA